MTDYITKVNAAVMQMRRKNPKHEVFSVLDKYMERYKIPNYYGVLDSLGFKIGIEAIAQPTYFGDEDYAGWMASLRYKPGNPLDKPSGELDLKEFRNSDAGAVKCYVLAAQKHVEELMKVPNLDYYVFKD